MFEAGVPSLNSWSLKSESASLNHFNLVSMLSLRNRPADPLSMWFSCSLRYSGWTPPLSDGFSGQYCIVKLATRGPAFLVGGFFILHVPGSRLADGLFRSSDNSELFSGLLMLNDPV